MGLVDSLAAEDRVEVRYSDFYRLVKAEAERALLRNAVLTGVPREQILKMMSGQNDELEEYRKTGLSPEQIREMDGFYREKCEELTAAAEERDALQKQLDDLQKQLDDLKAREQEPEKRDEATPAEEPKKRRAGRLTENIDVGKVMALKEAGWSVREIAAEMRTEPAKISRIIYAEKHKAKSADAEAEK